MATAPGLTRQAWTSFCLRSIPMKKLRITSLSLCKEEDQDRDHHVPDGGHLFTTPNKGIKPGRCPAWPRTTTLTLFIQATMTFTDLLYRPSKPNPGMTSRRVGGVSFAYFKQAQSQAEGDQDGSTGLEAPAVFVLWSHDSQVQLLQVTA